MFGKMFIKVKERLLMKYKGEKVDRLTAQDRNKSQSFQGGMSMNIIPLQFYSNICRLVGISHHILPNNFFLF